jgi:hypothetical protein
MAHSAVSGFSDHGKGAGDPHFIECYGRSCDNTKVTKHKPR